jgi:hypothetical protein
MEFYKIKTPLKDATDERSGEQFVLISDKPLMRTAIAELCDLKVEELDSESIQLITKAEDLVREISQAVYVLSVKENGDWNGKLEAHGFKAFKV